MRITVLPTSDEGWIAVLLFVALAIGIGVGITIWQRLWPSATKKLLEDYRYRQALGVYADHLSVEEPTRENRRAALAAATTYLVTEHGVHSTEASPNMRLVVAAYDRDQSYDLREQAVAYEMAGDYESALAYYERAAHLQADHDRKDYQVLQRCIARVSAKIG